MATFSKSWANRLKLVVDELFMNAVRYGSTENTSIVFVSFEYSDSGVRFLIEDDGTGPEASTPEKLREIIQANEKNKDLTRTSGRGLSMITKIWTDGMEIEKSEHGGIAVSFSKSTEAAVDPPPLPPPPTGLVALVQQAKAGGNVAAPVAQAPQPASDQPVAEPSGAGQAVAPSDAQQEVRASAPVQTPVYEFKLEGEIDQSNMDQKLAPINDQIEAMPQGAVLLVDFADVAYINSTVIGSIAGWHTHMQHKGGKLRLKNINNDIREILELVGLLNLLDIE